MRRHAAAYRPRHLRGFTVASSQSTNSDSHRTTDFVQQFRLIEKEEGVEAAQKAILDYLSIEPNAFQGFVALARILLKQGLCDDALRAAQKAKQLSPMNVDAPIAMGLVYLRMNDVDNAAAAFAEALRLEPNSARAHLGAAVVKFLVGDLDDALLLCEHVIELDPSIERAYELRARIQQKRQRSDIAIDELKSLLERNPSNVRAVKAYIQLMTSEGREQDAIAFLKENLEKHGLKDELSAADRKVIDMILRAAVRSERPDVAVDQFRKMIGAGISRPVDRALFIMSLIENGDLKEAESLIEEIPPRPALRPIALFLYGHLAQKSGDPREAVDCFRKACAAGKVKALSDENITNVATVDELANLWMVHLRKTLLKSFRDRRSDNEN